MIKYDTGLVALLTGEELDMDSAMEMTVDIFFLEIVHR